MEPLRSERALLRLTFALMGGLHILISIYAWTDRSSATDWAWLYRIGFPVSAATLLWGGVIRPRLIGLANLFVPFCTLATLRIVDFAQDLYLTPSEVELVGAVDRFLLASFSWGMAALQVLVIWTMERLLAARWSEDGEGALCWSAPGCPNYVPVHAR